MKRFLSLALIAALTPLSLLAQIPLPFDSCPGVSVAVTRPGFNATPGQHKIWLIDSLGNITPSGDPIDLQINAFGLNNEDGFLYAMYQTFNVANPFFARVGRNGKHRTLGTIRGPHVDKCPEQVSIINTAAGTVDDKDNYYFTAVVLNLQNVLMPPELYVGKIREISQLDPDNDPLDVTYRKIQPGTCIPELLAAFLNPVNGAFQDLAYNPNDGLIYTYFPGPDSIGGRIASFNPTAASPTLNCITPPAPNPPTKDLSGLYFGADSMLYILTIDGQYYKADVQTGEITLVTQTALPLLFNNLRGDMASCVGRRELQPFENCPGVALAITRPGFNATAVPHQIYAINSSTGAVAALGHPIDLQINAFGLNRKDGFLYGMHEVSDVFGPTLARVDRNGDYVDLDTIPPPHASNGRIGIINTAAATFDGNDNYYFTAVTLDTTNPFFFPRLYLGWIKKVSRLEPGERIHVVYRKIQLGDCIDEIIHALLDSSRGLFQDIAYNPDDGRIYTYIQNNASPSRGKLARFKVNGPRILDCMDQNLNPITQDLSGMHMGEDDKVYILTTDGKYYRGNPNNGVITLVAQTTLPLLANNLRGDMASCVRRGQHDDRGEGDDIVSEDFAEENGFSGEREVAMRVSPNPVSGAELVVSVNSPAQTNVEVQVLDMNGNSSGSERRVLVAGENRLRVSTVGLRSGTYAVILVFPSGNTTAIKFVRL